MSKRLSSTFKNSSLQIIFESLKTNQGISILDTLGKEKKKQEGRMSF